MKKSYPYRNAEMLMAASTIARNFNENIEILSPLRNNWTPEYANDLVNRINYAIDNYLQFDYRRGLREATAYLNSIQLPALRALSSFRMQVKMDFPGEKDEILKQLGFPRSFNDAKRTRSQEKLVEMLSLFNQGMNDKLKDKLTRKGLKRELIEQIMEYSEKYKVANATQENMKQSSLLLSRNVRNEFNQLYQEVIGICRIAYATFSSDPILRDHFSFIHVVRNLNAASRTPIEDPVTEESE